jgi:hypothetical protein
MVLTSTSIARCRLPIELAMVERRSIWKNSRRSAAADVASCARNRRLARHTGPVE